MDDHRPGNEVQARHVAWKRLIPRVAANYLAECGRTNGLNLPMIDAHIGLADVTDQNVEPRRHPVIELHLDLELRLLASMPDVLKPERGETNESAEYGEHPSEDVD